MASVHNKIVLGFKKYKIMKFSASGGIRRVLCRVKLVRRTEIDIK